MAKNKRYDTYGYSSDGKRVNVYVKDDKTYLNNGTRLPSGYSVQTKAGMYKMGNDGGYSVNAHNMPTPNYPTFDENNPLMKNLKFNSDKDYSKLGSDMYKPVYDAKRDTIRNRLNLDTEALSSQTNALNRMYDKQIQEQNMMNEQAKGSYNNETLSRGLGRSTIATTGLASMDMANQRAVGNINEGRSSALQNIHSRIQALTENANAELSTLDSNRSIEERNLAYQLEDRDRSHWLQEAQLNSPMLQSMQRRQWELEDKEYDSAMKQYDYDMGLERNLAQYRPGTQEYDIVNKEFANELNKKYQIQMQEFNTSMKNELQKYTPGTVAYKVAQGQFGDMKRQMDLEYQYQSKLAQLNASLSRKASTGNGFKNHEYAYYQNAKSGIDYIKNSDLDVKSKLKKIEGLKKDMNSDLQFNTSTSSAMKGEINALIDNEINYLSENVRRRDIWAKSNSQAINNADTKNNTKSNWFTKNFPSLQRTRK